MKTAEAKHQGVSGKGQKVPLDCLSVWQNAAPSLIFDIRSTQGEIILSPQNETNLPTTAQCLKGTLDGDAFWLRIDLRFFKVLFESIGAELDITSMNQADVALVIEHLFTDHIIALEEFLDCTLSFTDYVSPQDFGEACQFDFTIHSMDTVFDGSLFTNSLNTMNKLTNALLPFQANGEKNCSIIADVAIGPIALSQPDIAALAIGDMVSIGKGAEQNLDGFIKRANGTSWKALLGGSAAQLKSEKNSFTQLFKAEPDQVLLGLKLGTTNISANKLLNLKLEDELKIDRLPENAVHLILDNETLATGTLQTADGNLCIAIETLEAPNAND